MKRHYTMIPNDTVRDIRLSLAAQGLLSRILSLPPEFKLSIPMLRSHTGAGTEQLQKLKKELEKAGYVKVSPRRTETGKMRGQTWEVFAFTRKPITERTEAE